MTFADGQEVRFDVLAGDAVVWSSATGRTFPAEPADPLVPTYGRCTRWEMKWSGRTDAGGFVAAGVHTLRVTLRTDGDDGPTDQADFTVQDGARDGRSRS
jgi:hypothetical protein